MKSSARPSSARRRAEQLEHGGLHRDVERGGDLVADEQRRLGRERARDRDALALAAGELGRDSASASLGGSRTRSSSWPRSAAASRRAEAAQQARRAARSSSTTRAAG